MGSFFTSYENTTNSLIFHPPKTLPRDFGELEIPKRSRFLSELGIPCLLVHPLIKKSPNHCVVFSHGNGCDIYTMYKDITMIADALEIDVLIYDYPGYGLARSKQFSEQGCYNSLTTVIEWAKMRYQHIALMGHSLGTGVVMDHVATFDWNSTVFLLSPYKSMGRVVSDSTACSSLKSIDKFGTYYKLETIVCPVKIYHGEADTLIDISHAKDLFSSLRNQTYEPTWLANVGHNDILDVVIRDHMGEISKIMGLAR
jgi:abhydrolase domain-containing protein 17